MAQHFALRSIDEGVHVAEAPQGFYGLQLGTRMTVLQLEGGLLVYSPIAMPPESVQGLGDPRWVMAPNLFHHLYVGPWADAGLECWGPKGLDAKRPDLSFDGIAEPGPCPFGGDIEMLPMRCMPMSNEVVLLHKPSRTLVTTDLVFNLTPAWPAGTRLAMRCIGGYPGCRSTALERVAMRRDQARKELSAILEWDFDRIIMAHGEVIESGGHAALRNAFRWLGL